jgi:hypothetical protein
MSSAVATHPIYHTVTWGSHTWVCIHPLCDGSHHVFVACER